MTSEQLKQLQDEIEHGDKLKNMGTGTEKSFLSRQLVLRLLEERKLLLDAVKAQRELVVGTFFRRERITELEVARVVAAMDTATAFAEGTP